MIFTVVSSEEDVVVTKEQDSTSKVRNTAMQANKRNTECIPFLVVKWLRQT